MEALKFTRLDLLGVKGSCLRQRWIESETEQPSRRLVPSFRSAHLGSLSQNHHFSLGVYVPLMPAFAPKKSFKKPSEIHFGSIIKLRLILKKLFRSYFESFINGLKAKWFECAVSCTATCFPKLLTYASSRRAGRRAEGTLFEYLCIDCTMELCVLHIESTPWVPN